MLPLIGGLGTPRSLLILAIVVLLFGASKLPELARGSGRALRIFKAETKGLMDDDDDEAAKPTTTPEQRELEAAARRARRRERAPGRRATRGRAPRRRPGLTREQTGRCRPSGGSSTSCAASRSTPSAPTAGWRSRTTSVSSAPG